MQNDDQDNMDLWPPIDESQDRELRIQTGMFQPGAITRPEPIEPDSAGELPEAFPPSTPEPWDPNNLKANHIVGTGDCYLGEVGYSYDAAADSVLAQKGIIDVQRVQPWTDGAGAMTLGEIPPPLSSPNISMTQATPLPCVDQAAYFGGKKGDPVLVLTGRDGRAYYIPDNAPFIGVVAQNPDDDSTKETNFAGAGNTTLRVTRQIMTGDPESEAPTFGDTDPAVEYKYVFPLTADGQHHGYRVGDTVLCFRRGLYVFCLPGRTSFHGKIIATPAGEDALTDDRYWVKLVAGNVTYAGDVNVWAWGTDGDLEITVCAANLAERADGTHNVTTGTEVVVTLFADASSNDKSAYWVFSLASPSAKWFRAYEAWTYDGVYDAKTNDCYVMCHPCDDQYGTNADTDIDVKIWLPRGGLTEDPNVEADVILAATLDNNGEYIALDSHLDGKVYSSIRQWFGEVPAGGGTLPTGWHLLDGTVIRDGTAFPSASGRALVGQRTPISEAEGPTVLGASDDYQSVGTVGGNAWHGQSALDDEYGLAHGANNHPDHTAHTHDVTLPESYISGQEAGQSVPESGTYTSGTPEIGGVSAALEHGGNGSNGGYTDTDNRMPYLVVAMIMRDDNSEEGEVPLNPLLPTPVL